MKTLDAHIAIDPTACAGKPHIAGHRITVQNIALWHEWMGRSVDEIVAEYHLDLSDVHAALAYYYDHKSEIDAAVQEDDQFVAEMKAKSVSLLASKVV